MKDMQRKDEVKIKTMIKDIIEKYRGDIKDKKDIDDLSNDIKKLSDTLNKNSKLKYIPQRPNYNSIAVYDKILLFYIDFQTEEVILSESIIEKEDLEAEKIINHNRLISIEYLLKTEDKIKELREEVKKLNVGESNNTIIKKLIHRIKYQTSKTYREEQEAPYLNEIRSIKKRQLNMNERINKIIEEQEAKSLYFKDHYSSYVEEVNFIKKMLSS